MKDKDRTVVRLVLTGTLTVTDRAMLDACLDKYARLFAWIGLWDATVISRWCRPTVSSPISASAGSPPPRWPNWSTPPGPAKIPRWTPRGAGAAAEAGRAAKGGGMRLHRLVLTNYRGITHREIDFPERGVTVVAGPTRSGKSSMIEALDLLLESKDRSTKKDVKQVKPTHADVGSEVTAEISTGKYRFVYRKRFHKKCETELTSSRRT